MIQWSVDVSVCRRFGLSTFRFVDVLVCRRFGCRRFGLSTFWPVTFELGKSRNPEGFINHCSDAMINAMASQINSVSTVCFAACSCIDQTKHLSPASLTFVRGIHQWPVTGGFLSQKASDAEMFLFDDVIMRVSNMNTPPFCSDVVARTTCFPSGNRRSNWICIQETCPGFRHQTNLPTPCSLL